MDVDTPVAANCTVSTKGPFTFKNIETDLKPPGNCASWIMKNSESCLRPPIAHLLQSLEPKQEPSFRKGWSSTNFHQELFVNERSTEAAVMQVVGDVCPVPCVACQLKMGPFSHCIRAADIDCCANCWSMDGDRPSDDDDDTLVFNPHHETFYPSSPLRIDLHTSQLDQANSTMGDECMDIVMEEDHPVTEAHNMNQMYDHLAQTSDFLSTRAESIQDKWRAYRRAVRLQDIKRMEELNTTFEEHFLEQQGVAAEMGYLVGQMGALLQQQGATPEMSSLVSKMEALLRAN